MDAEHHSLLALLIRQHTDRVIAEWSAFAETRLPAAQSMTALDLEDSVRQLLIAISADLELPQTAHAQTEKSQGNAHGNGSGIIAAARAHADDRVQAGFNLDQCIAEFRALRASVLRLITLQDDSTLYLVNDIVRFNETIDEVVAVSSAYHRRLVDRARDMFIAVLGHDLREPLSAITMSAERVLRLGAVHPECLAVGDQILRSSRRMSRMMDDLLDFNRARAGIDLPLEPVDVDFANICRIATAESSAAHPKAVILCDWPKSIVGKWDSARLGQLITNLLANAISYGAPGRPVTVSLSTNSTDERDCAVLTVHNEGSPIPAAELANVFNPLTRGIHSTTDRPAHSSGLGLGLFIVKSIATAHRGQVSVTSAADTGTSFTVVLPLAW